MAMIKEEKDLLVKDLSARIPYGVKLKFGNQIGILTGLEKIGVVDIELKSADVAYTFHKIVEDVKPYLLPLSSMTKEQRIELSEVSNAIYIYSSDAEIVVDRGRENLLQFTPVFDWLNAHHFDYRVLIEKGLAIDSTALNIY